MATLEVRRDGEVVPDASLALLRIRNAGSLDISEEHFDAPLYFTFGGRKVVGVGITPDTRTSHTEMILAQKDVTDKNKLVLPKFSLNRRERFKLVVLLTGNKGNGGVAGDCHMKGGKIVRDSNRVGQSKRSLVLGAIFVAAVGLLVGLLVSQPGAQPLESNVSEATLSSRVRPPSRRLFARLVTTT
jgi:phosphate transport system substrate-binding protein